MPLRQFSPTELVLTQRMRLERPLLLLVLLGAGGFALAEGNVLYLLLTGVGVLVNIQAVGRRAEVYVPRVIVNAGVLVASGLFVIDFMARDTVLPALGHYLVLIQLCKLFEQKRNRDYVQMIALSLVLMVAGAMMTAGLWFGLLLIAYVPVACYVAMVLTLKLGLDRQAKARLPVEAEPIDPQRVAWNTSAAFPVRPLRLAAGAAALICLLSGVGTFLLMPRGLQGAFSDLQLDGRGRLTGFGNSISLREVGPIYRDPTVMMRLRLEDAAGRPVNGPTYLRGRAFDNYANGAWYASRRRPVLQPAAPAAPDLSEPDFAALNGAAGNTLLQRITMDTSLLPTLFALAPAYQCDPPAGLHLTSTRPDFTADRYIGGPPIEYAVRSWRAPLASWQVAWLGPESEETIGDSLEGKVPPALEDLARQWAGDLVAERDAAEGAERDRLDLAVATRLAERLSGHCTYTLDLEPVAPGADPVEDFVVRTRAGHCELFASAETLMCRSLGVPARVAAGFLADGRIGEGEYLVRGADAHAWTEVYTPTTGWQLVDATPPGSVGGRDGSFARVRRWWDSVGFSWRSRVIGYGDRDRRDLFGPLVDRLDRAARRAAGFLYDSARGLWDLLVHGRVEMNLQKTALAGAGLAGAVLGWILLWRWGRWVRRAASRWRRRAGLPAYYGRLLNVLRRAGLEPLPQQTDREFLAAAAGGLSLPPAAVEGLGELLYRMRWGGDEPGAEELASAERAVGEIAGILRHRHPRGPSI